MGIHALITSLCKAHMFLISEPTTTDPTTTEPTTTDGGGGGGGGGSTTTGMHFKL